MDVQEATSPPPAHRREEAAAPAPAPAPAGARGRVGHRRGARGVTVLATRLADRARPGVGALPR